MLSIKNLVKIYKTKGGVEVRALDGVSVDFPDTGMVFLLGRSGSGKSTLLNVSGGLDQPTEGEIIIKGKSSKDFSTADFDSYRNTYVGFVFQEYNILEDFSVEQNISLALQLQNKPADKQAVKNILDVVDLSGVEKRKPNTLSGGQRQRVAIARALIKDPKIIMADEPTGALDSNTGKQIFETLKKLSKDRLVIVVSHDRSFAELYGDRIIELADGKVISDVSKAQIVQTNEQNVTIIDDQTITVKDWNSVSEQDFASIISAMKKCKGETVITSNPQNLPEIKKLAGVKESEITYSFNKTEEKDIKREQHTGDTAFIKSRLPLKHAFKLAFEGLKTKPLRLVFTIFLAIVSFVFFGLSSTLMLYNPQYSIASALEVSPYTSIVLNQEYDASYKQTTLSSSSNNKYEYTDRTVQLRSAFTQNDIDRLNQNDLGLNFAGIIDLGAYSNTLDSVNGYMSNRYPIYNVNVNYDYKFYYCVQNILGFSDCGEQYLKDNGFSLLAGRYPLTANEVAIPEYIYELFAHSRTSVNAESGYNYQSPADIINKTITLGNITLTVVGVYDVGDIPQKFQELLNKDTELDAISKKQLSDELADIIENSFHSLVFVSSDFYAKHRNDNLTVQSVSLRGIEINVSPITYGVNEFNSTAQILTEKSVWKHDYVIDFYNLNNEKIEYAPPQENQVYLPVKKILTSVPYEFYRTFANNYNSDIIEQHPEFAELAKKYISSGTNLSAQETIEFVRLLAPTYKAVTGNDFEIPTTVYAKNYRKEEVSLNVVGYYIYTSSKNSNVFQYFVSDSFYQKYAIKEDSDDQIIVNFESQYSPDPLNEKYGGLITPTQNTTEQTYFILNSANEHTSYIMDNLVFETTSNMASIISSMKVGFYLACIVFGIFASLMLFNFISASINAKSKEIGILRAVGARKNDVFKIFIIETLIITLSCFIVSAVLSGFLCSVINTYTLANAFMITLLKYSVINVLILLVVSVVVSICATIIPVSKAANKSPVDIIRAL